MSNLPYCNKSLLFKNRTYILVVLDYANSAHDSEVLYCNHFIIPARIRLHWQNTKHIGSTPSECKGSTANKQVTLLGPTDDPEQRSGAEGSTSDGGDTVPAHKIIRLGLRRIRTRMHEQTNLHCRLPSKTRRRAVYSRPRLPLVLTLQLFIQLSKTVNSMSPYLINVELMVDFLIPVGNEFVVIYFA